MTITSTAVAPSGNILPEYTCDGASVSPPLTFSDIPDGTQSLVMIMEDPDAPGRIYTHWLLYDMSPTTLQILEGQMPLIGKTGLNDSGETGYTGPCPPSGIHRYFFTLFALDAMLGLPEGATKDQVRQGMDGHIIDSAELVGQYQKATAA